MRTLDELHSDQPRFSVLRDLPPTKKLPEPARSFLAVALALDRGVSALIRYCLAESVAHISKKDRRWLKYIEAIEGKRTVEARLIVELTSDADDLVGRQARITEAAIKNIKELLSDLDEFDKVAGPMREHLQYRINQLKTQT